MFLYLGYFVDGTQKPKPSDIIVSLGGGDGSRIKKALALYKQGYSTSGKFIYTGYEIVNPALVSRFNKRQFLIQNGIAKNKIVTIADDLIFNTAEELYFLKSYMQKYNYKSVLIVSSPIHTTRIKILAKYLANFDDSGIKYTVTSFTQDDWDPSSYYQDPWSRKSVFMEFQKLIYNLLKYSPLLIDKTSYAKKKDGSVWKEALKRL